MKMLAASRMLVERPYLNKCTAWESVKGYFGFLIQLLFFVDLLGRTGMLTKRHSMTMNRAKSRIPSGNMAKMMEEFHVAADPPCDNRIFPGLVI